MSKSTAVLFLAHMWNDDIRASLEKLVFPQDPDMPDLWLLSDARTPGLATLAMDGVRSYQFDEDKLFEDLSYPRLHNHGIINHAHFPVLHFFQHHEEYRHYWFIEYDVRYTGSWKSFFSCFNQLDHDLITTHLRRFDQEPDWVWWDSLYHPCERIKRDNYIRSYNVIYRISNQALKCIHSAHRRGWRGHNEVLLPTLLLNAGLSLLDLGGAGEFVLPGYRNRFYTSCSLTTGGLRSLGTIRYRPARRKEGRRRNMLYHPVKAAPYVESITTKIGIAIEEWAAVAGMHLRRLFSARPPNGALFHKKSALPTTRDVSHKNITLPSKGD